MEPSGCGPQEMGVPAQQANVRVDADIVRLGMQGDFLVHL